MSKEWTTISSSRSAARFTSVMVVFHAALGIAFFAAMILIVPRFAKLFADFGLAVPGFTILIFDISRWLVNYWYVLPFAFIPFAVTDAVVIFVFRLRPGTKWLSTLWVGLMFGLWLAAFLVATIGMLIPWVKLQEGLSK